MKCLGDIVQQIRSKNAGPFTVTIDVFCGTHTVFESLRTILSNETISLIYSTPTDSIQRFEIPQLNVIKFSFPRPHVQGSRLDSDMHAAQFAELLKEYVIEYS